MTGPVAPYLRHISALIGPMPVEALAEDDIVGDEVAVHLQPRPHVLHERAGALQEIVVDVVAQPAEAVVAVGQPGAADALKQVEDLLAVVEGVKEAA